MGRAESLGEGLGVILSAIAFPLAAVRSLDGRGGSGWRWGGEGCRLLWSGVRGVLPALRGSLGT